MGRLKEDIMAAIHRVDCCTEADVANAIAAERKT